MFLWSRGLRYMRSFMAGAIRSGQSIAIRADVKASSAMPAAILPMMFAVAGATRARSRPSVISMCPMVAWSLLENSSYRTGLRESVSKVSRDTNFSALAVIATRTSAPCSVSLLSRSTALYAAILPVTPSRIRFPVKTPLCSTPETPYSSVSSVCSVSASPSISSSAGASPSASSAPSSSADSER